MLKFDQLKIGVDEWEESDFKRFLSEICQFYKSATLYSYFNTTKNRSFKTVVNTSL